MASSSLSRRSRAGSMRCSRAAPPADRRDAPADANMTRAKIIDFLRAAPHGPADRRSADRTAAGVSLLDARALAGVGAARRRSADPPRRRDRPAHRHEPGDRDVQRQHRLPRLPARARAPLRRARLPPAPPARAPARHGAALDHLQPRQRRLTADLRAAGRETSGYRADSGRSPLPPARGNRQVPVRHRTKP